MADSEKDPEELQKEADKAQEEADKAQEEADTACNLYHEAKDDDSKIPDGKSLDDLKKDCFDKQEIADKEQAIADKKQKKADKALDESEHVTTFDATSHINIKGFVPFEPYKAYKYRVIFVPISIANRSMEDIKKSKFNTFILLGANAVLGFNEIKGISNETPAYSYNEGGENTFGNTFPMHTGAGDVTLSHGATRMPTMSLIRNMVSGSKDSICEFAQFHLIIFMYGKGLPQFWVLRNVWPTKIEIGGFSTDIEDKDNVIIESLTVSVERAEVEAVAVTNAFKKNF